MTPAVPAERGVVTQPAPSSSRPSRSAPVVVLGAGVNGAAIARELALSGLSVWVVDIHDIAYGATAYSSRLIHGGLRYLEYGEFALVRESLAERARLLRLAPHLVRPLELVIPLCQRRGGLLAAGARAVGWRWWPSTGASRAHGLWAVRAGLTLYDRWSDAASLPKHRVLEASRTGLPLRADYRWACEYFDAQITFPERLTVEMLADAQQRAAHAGADFRLFTRTQARWDGRRCHLSRASGVAAEPLADIEPLAIINATGAWVDDTLRSLGQASQRLIGGTKGSHLVVFHDRLQGALGGRGMYVEAPDGRPVFILPLETAVLIGTTDLPFSGDPATAVATEAEIAYLLEAVNRVLPAVRLGRDDVNFHCCGVRPLPFVGPRTAASVTRRHFIHVHAESPIPLLSIVGGKLTTCRSLAEQTAAKLLPMVGRPVERTSADEIYPGGNDFPRTAETLDRWRRGLAEASCAPVAVVSRAIRLWGARAGEVLRQAQAIGEPTRGAEAAPDVAPRQALRLAAPFSSDAGLTDGLVRWTIRQEWASTLGDLIERRLMLLYDEQLSAAALRRMALLLADERQGDLAAADAELASAVDRLQRHFGKAVALDSHSSGN